jgi:hypothetical protein
MKKVVFIILLLLPVAGICQNNVNVGIGGGLDYGGFGGKFTFLPSEKVGLFAGLGYNLVGAGFNAGALYKFSTEKKVRPYATAMYGYNGVIKIEEGPASDETYYGVSFGIGIELKARKNENNFWNFELLVPIRPSEFSDDIDRLKDSGYSVSVSFSIGYHFGF